MRRIELNTKPCTVPNVIEFFVNCFILISIKFGLFSQHFYQFFDFGIFEMRIFYPFTSLV